MAKTASIMWRNLFTCWDAVLRKLNDNLHVFLFPAYLICSLTTLWIRRWKSQAASCMMRPSGRQFCWRSLLKKQPKKIHFFQQSRQTQSAKRSGLQSFRPASGRGISASAFLLSSKASSFSASAGGEKVLQVSCLCLSCRWEVLSGSIMIPGILGGSLLQLPQSIPPPPTCDVGTFGIPFLRFGISTSSGVSGGSEQAAGQRHHGGGRQVQDFTAV